MLDAETLARLRALLDEAEAFEWQHGCLSHLTAAECAGCAAECALTESLREHARALLDLAGEQLEKPYATKYIIEPQCLKAGCEADIHRYEVKRLEDARDALQAQLAAQRCRCGRGGVGYCVGCGAPMAWPTREPRLTYTESRDRARTAEARVTALELAAGRVWGSRTVYCAQGDDDAGASDVAYVNGGALLDLGAALDAGGQAGG